VGVACNPDAVAVEGGSGQVVAGGIGLEDRPGAGLDLHSRVAAEGDQPDVGSVERARPAQQIFVLTVDQAPAITSAAGTTSTLGALDSFTVANTGFPTSTISQSGALLAGIGFFDNHNGTGTLSDALTASGVLNISFAAANEVGSGTTQGFMLMVPSGGPIAKLSPASINFRDFYLYRIGTGAVTPRNSGSSNLKIGRISLTH